MMDFVQGLWEMCQHVAVLAQVQHSPHLANNLTIQHKFKRHKSSP